MDPQLTCVDRAEETVYLISRRARGATQQLASWVGPNQLIVVVPPGGLYFHEPYCPRAGQMEHAQYMPLTRALRQQLRRCLLCWPIHRDGESPHWPPHGVGTSALSPLDPRQTAPTPVHLDVRVPRLPSPRVRLPDPSPCDYVTEWQVLFPLLLACVPHFAQARRDVVPRSGLQGLRQEWIGWPDLLHATRRYMPRGPAASAPLPIGGAAGSAPHREQTPRYGELSLLDLPTEFLLLRPSGDSVARPGTRALAQQTVGAWGAIAFPHDPPRHPWYMVAPRRINRLDSQRGASFAE